MYCAWTRDWCWAHDRTDICTHSEWRHGPGALLSRLLQAARHYSIWVVVCAQDVQRRRFHGVIEVCGFTATGCEEVWGAVPFLVGWRWARNFRRALLEQSFNSVNELETYLLEHAWILFFNNKFAKTADTKGITLSSKGITVPYCHIISSPEDWGSVCAKSLI